MANTPDSLGVRNMAVECIAKMPAKQQSLFHSVGHACQFAATTLAALSLTAATMQAPNAGRLNTMHNDAVSQSTGHSESVRPVALARSIPSIVRGSSMTPSRGGSVVIPPKPGGMQPV